MTESFIVVGLKTKSDTHDQLRCDLSALVEPSRNENGNISYELFEDQNEPGLFIFVEEWASTEAHNKHHEHSVHI
ncbi:putative quinol monooxygenase [Pseudomonas syringae]|uniref:putative quinol monooxygenase n=1 Tax=Pseudomonas syringae TaxID=317 RepID=UPI0007C4CA1E|nr:putative quinol monooxygenase [Pseudomonas syringae]